MANCKFAIAIALFGLVALASVAHGESGSVGASGGHSVGLSGSSLLGSKSTGSMSSMSTDSSRTDSSGSNFYDRDSSGRTLDSFGGYRGHDDRYWWNGGYWSDGCFGCGTWYCYECGVPVCPVCQWYDRRSKSCVRTSTCGGSGSVPGAVGRKLLESLAARQR